MDFLTVLQGEAQGISLRGLADRAERISLAYRQFDSSAGAVRHDDDVLAYALARAPATYAAISHVLSELVALVPGFAPHAMLDLGAGPGTASWAASALFPQIERHVLVDHNAAFLSLAQRLVEAAETPGLRQAQVERGDLARPQSHERADLVVFGYALTELPDNRVSTAVDRAWAMTDGVLVIVEPGRPRDYERLMSTRDRLLALGAKIIGPCPHALACPLFEDDWCHFSVRLARSRDHQALKHGALGYEDEKFSYLVLAKPGVDCDAGWSRVVKPTIVTKFSVDIPLCTPTGTQETQTVLKRSGHAFKGAKKLAWGDRFVPDEP